MKITILLPTYNRLENLKFAIQSILSQTYDNFQLIIINDASNDGTFEFLKSLNYEMINCKIIHNEENLGLQKSLNRGLLHATGELIARIDDDDEWIDKNKLEKQVNCFYKNKNLVLLGTGAEFNGKKFRNPLLNRKIRQHILFRCPFYHSTVMFKHIVNNQKVFYNDAYPYSEDWELWLRLGNFGEIQNLPDITTLISKGLNMSKTYYTIQHKMNLEIIRGFYAEYPNALFAMLYHKAVIFYFSIGLQRSKVHKTTSKLFYSVFHRN